MAPISKSATNSVPKKCTCGRTLPKKPEYGWADTKPCKVLGKWPSIWWYRSRGMDKVWFVKCKCSNLIIWSHPSVWVVRNPNPLFDSLAVIG